MILAKASLLQKFITYGRKKFYNIGHCHYDRKTFMVQDTGMVGQIKLDSRGLKMFFFSVKVAPQGQKRANTGFTQTTLLLLYLLVILLSKH